MLHRQFKKLRALDRFVKSAINILKREDFDDEIFRKRVEKNTQILEKSRASLIKMIHIQKLWKILLPQ